MGDVATTTEYNTCLTQFEYPPSQVEQDELVLHPVPLTRDAHANGYAAQAQILLWRKLGCVLSSWISVQPVQDLCAACLLAACPHL